MLPNPYETPRTERDNRSANPDQQKGPFAGCAAAAFMTAGAIGVLLGSAWIRTFGFTDYRAHLADIGLPLGILTLVISVVLIAFGIGAIETGWVAT